jgi:uncharacterized membrane protein YphA (DoxX/SURF4 family)
MTVTEVLEELYSQLELLVAALRHFLEVLFGVSPWMDSNFIAVLAALFTYYWIFRVSLQGFNNLYAVWSAYIWKCWCQIQKLKDCSLNSPLYSALLILEAAFYIVAGICVAVGGIALVLGAGYLLFAWLGKVMTWQGLVS